MTTQPAIFRTPAHEGSERWEISGQRGAYGWVDRARGVGRIESDHDGADLSPGGNALLDELGRRYPGVRWFSARAP